MKKLLLTIFLSLIWCLPISANEVGKNVYLNACGNNSDKYYDSPLNIENILVEAPNKIVKLEKSKYDREFQTLATSRIELDGNEFEISVSNFRDLIIKSNTGELLEERKISGASSIYEFKHKNKIVAWGVGWHKYCKEYYSDIDFTVLRIFVPIKKNNKVSIQQTVVSLNLSETYKATSNSDNLILAHGEDILGSSGAATYYYEGVQFFEIDNQNDLKPIVSFDELNKKISNIKKNCFSKDNYKDITDLVRNCYYWYSSLVLEVPKQ